MNNTKYIKSFSSGQITIPKDIRDELGMQNEFWLKLYVKENKIIAEPIVTKINKAEYLQKLLKIKGKWFNKTELFNNRKQLEKQIQNRSL